MPIKRSTTPKSKPMKFKEAFERLERIVLELEGDEADVEEAMKKYAEGLQLVHSCKERLEEVENEVKEIKERYAHNE